MAAILNKTTSEANKTRSTSNVPSLNITQNLTEDQSNLTREHKLKALGFTEIKNGSFTFPGVNISEIDQKSIKKTDKLP